jgi:adenylylsulfate kinase
MESRRRSLVKALSWRVIALVVTTGLGYMLTSSAAFAISIGVADSLIKILAYYLHERAWMGVSFGLSPKSRSGVTSSPTSTRG